jgi:hypothetical protein
MKRKILVATQNGSYKLPPSNRKIGGGILTFYLQLFMNFYVFIIIKISVFSALFLLNILSSRLCKHNTHPEQEFFSLHGVWRIKAQKRISCPMTRENNRVTINVY